MSSSPLVIAHGRPDSEEAMSLIRALDDELRVRYLINETHGLHPEDVRDPRLIFLIARIDGRCVACGAVRELESGVGEIKRMFVRPECRGRGIGRQLLSELESHARAGGYSRVQLETGTLQPEAIGLYKSAGYRERALFGDYVDSPLSVFLEKPLS